jgi:hypothetical protein
MYYMTLIFILFVAEEQLKLVNEYNTGSDEARSLLERRYGRKQLQRLVDTVLSEQWVSTNSQNCPKCNVSIEVRLLLLFLYPVWSLGHQRACKPTVIFLRTGSIVTCHIVKCILFRAPLGN